MQLNYRKLRARSLALFVCGAAVGLMGFNQAQACSIDRWSEVTGSVTTNGKRYEGSCGAKVQIGGQNLLTDLNPSNEKVYVASFYAFLGEMSLGETDEVVIFSADQGPGDPEVQLHIQRSILDHRLVLRAFDDSGSSALATPASINYGWNQIQLWWEAASAPGADDGFVDLRVNGIDVGSLSGLDNDLGAIEEARLGRVGGILNAPDRFFDLDLFESRRTGNWVEAYAPFSDITNFSAEIMTLYNTGITSGCAVGKYCPDSPITRAQMAVFILRAMLGSYYNPPSLPQGVSTFSDINPADPNHFATWVEEFFQTGITSGCAVNPRRYCPDAAVTRGQMAVFILRGIEGSDYVPPELPPEGSSFDDITSVSHFPEWVEELYRRGITGGCGGGNYCPETSVTRGQMAAFLKRGFGLPITASEATNSH